MDDILICANSLHKVEKDLNLTISTLSNLGFSINYSKSCLIPSRIITHLGYIWNSDNMTVSLPLEKLEKIKNIAGKCLDPCKTYPIRFLATLLGLLVSSSNGFMYAPLYYRNFQLCFIDAVKSCENWDDCWLLNTEARADLLWWVNCDNKDIVPVALRPDPSSLILFTDASNHGWGSSLSSGEMISGSWSISEKSEHINYLELRAILLSVIHFSDILKISQ